ncbi:MraZ protein [Legionella cherrii]|uniref:Transcriptional regulator MraZ n=2 Tax=Legionella cherrii TaxID=28084 RepID=A0A0W0S626_9GAMM|nr:MraZ protein [Legionella cherrii]VEB36320.1 MraZ protein [Legionella cherrii]
MKAMFRGINAITIDTKGRLAIPTRYRSALGAEEKTPLVVTIDTEETCLLLYTASQWQIIENNLQKLPSFNAAARRIQRLLIGHATDVELDANGRVLLPTVLRTYAQLEKDVVMIGQGNKFEVWNKDLWETRREQWLAEESSGTGGLPDEMKTFSL